MKTLENNKLIAEFLGYIDNGCSEDGFLIHPVTNYDVEISGLKYHEDWNQLMKAVKRIDEISLNAPIVWNLEGKTNDIFNSIREVNIELTYNRVIDFINFYNNQNKIIFRNTFTDCDDFANYILDSILEFGQHVTEEFNLINGIYLPIGTNVYQIAELPNAGKNYKKFGTVKSWLYDLYEIKIKFLK